MKTDNTVEGILQNLADRNFKVFKDNGTLTKCGEKHLQKLLDLLWQINFTITESRINVDSIEYQLNNIIRRGF